MFETDNKLTPSVIKVVGVGGAGSNAVDHMIREEIQGVEFICINTDAQALARNSAPLKLQLGDTGLGAGARPDVGRKAATDARERIAEALRGAHMAFVTAGMGGGTGTGAGPVVAEIARELGILTVAVVTKPFIFEGKRQQVAEEGIKELSRHVDSLIVVLNERLLTVLGDDVSMQEAFKAADDVLRNAVGGIAEIINFPGLVNVDFEDVRTVMAEMGMAMMGSAYACGVDRARLAAQGALSSPLLEGVHLSGARGVLVNITASNSLRMKEVSEVMEEVRAYAAEDAQIVFGAVFDEAMQDDLRVTVVATGLEAGVMPSRETVTLMPRRTGTDNVTTAVEVLDYRERDVPAVVRQRREGGPAASNGNGKGDRGYDAPAFLRRRAE